MTQSMPQAPKHTPMFEDQDENGNWVNEPGKIYALEESDPFEKAVETFTDRCFTEAENLGWHKSYDEIVKAVHRGEKDEADYLAWIQAKMLLIVGEVCEAQEELRNGRDVKEVYFRDVDGNIGPVDATYDAQVYAVAPGGNTPLPQLKPEGWLVEMGDALIRLGDLVGTVAGQEGVMFGPIVAGKLAYNTTRGVMHGGKKF